MINLKEELEKEISSSLTNFKENFIILSLFFNSSKLENKPSILEADQYITTYESVIECRAKIKFYNKILKDEEMKNKEEIIDSFYNQMTEGVRKSIQFVK